MRSDRVLRRPAPSRASGTTGRSPRHGGEFILGGPARWGEPDAATTTDTRLYGTASAQTGRRLHPRLAHRTAWISQDGQSAGPSDWSRRLLSWSQYAAGRARGLSTQAMVPGSG
ncbi:hypothetical protein Ait01nite_017620 [Actinoplanes italicus]|nr:hypothetical protein Ait01nite_017620 [Actinoplanes italicus]